MAKQKRDRHSRKNQDKYNKLWGHNALFVILILVFASLSIPTLLQNLQKPTLDNSSYTILTSMPKNNLDFVTYKSEKLGMSFSYQTSIPGNTQTARIVEKGNNIYLCYDGTTQRPLDDCYYVQIFTKNKYDTFETALEKQFLNGYEHNCYLNNAQKWNTPPQYQILEIEPYISDSDKTLPAVEAISLLKTRCPSPYTRITGAAFFLYDPNYPNKYAFVDSGQDAANGDGNHTWFETITFF